MAGTSLKAIPRVDFNAAGLMVNYQPLTVTGLPAACFIVKISNQSNIAIDLSYDGVTAHEYIRADSDFFLPIQMNAQPTAWEVLIPKGSKMYIKATGAGIGTIYLSAYYV